MVVSQISYVKLADITLHLHQGDPKIRLVDITSHLHHGDPKLRW